MDIEYHYFDVSPAEDDDALSLEEAREIIVSNFPMIEEDEAAALLNANARYKALQQLGAPEELLRLYEDPKVTRIQLTDDDLDEYYVEFDLWDKQGMLVYPKPDEDRLEECKDLAIRLANSLGYKLSVEVYD